MSTKTQKTQNVQNSPQKRKSKAPKLSWEQRQEEFKNKKKENLSFMLERFPESKILTLKADHSIISNISFALSDINDVLINIDKKIDKHKDKGDYKESMKEMEKHQEVQEQLLKMLESMNTLREKAFEDGNASYRMIKIKEKEDAKAAKAEEAKAAKAEEAKAATATKTTATKTTTTKTTAKA